MNDRRCGTCLHFVSEQNDHGWCMWKPEPVPSSWRGTVRLVLNYETHMPETGGADCPCYGLGEERSETDE